MQLLASKVQNHNWDLESATFLSECDLGVLSWDKRKTLLEEFPDKSGTFATSAYDIYEYLFIKLLTSTPPQDLQKLFVFYRDNT